MEAGKRMVHGDHGSLALHTDQERLNLATIRTYLRKWSPFGWPHGSLLRQVLHEYALLVERSARLHARDLAIIAKLEEERDKLTREKHQLERELAIARAELQAEGGKQSALYDRLRAVLERLVELGEAPTA
jgi:hypothetical protein